MLRTTWKLKQRGFWEHIPKERGVKDVDLGHQGRDQNQAFHGRMEIERETIASRVSLYIRLWGNILEQKMKNQVVKLRGL